MVKLSEKILFDVNVDMIEGDVEIFNYCLDTTTETDVPENFRHMLYAVLANAKATEPDDEIIPVNKGTRRPANHAERRKATAHAKNRRQTLATYSMDEIRPNGKVKNSGIREYLKGDKVYSRKDRRSGKHICRRYAKDDSFSEEKRLYYSDIEKGYIEEDDFDPNFNLYGYTQQEKTEISTDHLHGDFSDDDINRIIAENNPFRRMVEAWGCDDDYCDDDWDYDCWDEYNDCPYPSIDDLYREIEIYKSFLNAFNLNTLFRHWKDKY